MELVGHSDTVASLAWSSDGALLATAGLDASVLVWDVMGNKKATLEGPVEGVEFVRWHPRGPVVLAGSEDFSAWMWNATSGACMQVCAPLYPLLTHLVGCESGCGLGDELTRRFATPRRFPCNTIVASTEGYTPRKCGR